LLVVFLSPASALTPAVTGTSLLLLVILGGLAARAGGASPAIGAMRVGFWGALAMAITYAVGALFGAVV
jgi:vacuolar iron transporter family protein